MKYFAYVLKDSQGKFYKGFTSDLSRRLKEHRSGHTKTTRFMDNPSLVYSEEFDTLNEARKREVYLKTAAGRRFLKKVLNKGS
ncbi:MAG: GIY-YIG nuclease family protein [Candidatus Pacebacteria bacterium]|nr:GIY-YIG nuclease family protein [Candidatus Paceibacterota bacterium]